MLYLILSDMHGNPLALDAVLADIAAQGGVDETWVLGDLAALGYDPVGVLVWLPVEGCFGAWDGDHWDLITFPEPAAQPAQRRNGRDAA